MGNKKQNFISAVVYVHNAENRIEDFLQTVIAVMDDFECSEIICVNDFSEDNSVKAIKKITERTSATSISILHMSFFHGLDLAMNAGVDLAVGDFVFEFDTTVLDFDKNAILEVYYRALQGYDIVSASPNRKEKLSSRLFYRVFEQFSDYSYRMTTESFRILSRRVINRIHSANRILPYRKAVYAGCGLKTDHIRYKAFDHISLSFDKKELKYRPGLAIDSLILFTKLGYKFSLAMTLFMMFASIFMLIYSIAIYASSHPVAGWTTTILFMSVVFFGLFVILTIVIKYLQLLVELIFKRKHYSFEGIEKITK